jgi:hypothetical protein
LTMGRLTAIGSMFSIFIAAPVFCAVRGPAI